MKKLFFVLVLLLPFWGQAQTDPPLGNYLFLKSWQNPAYAGVEDAGRLRLNYRLQWIKLPQPLHTVFATYDQQSDKLKGGLGATFCYDFGYHIATTFFDLQYNYHLKVGQSAQFRFGVEGGLAITNLDTSGLVFQNPEPNLHFTRVNPDLGTGIWYESEGFFGGISARHLTPFLDNLGNDRQTRAWIYVIAGYHVKTGNFILTPSTRIANEVGLFVFTEASFTAYWKEKAFAGISGMVIPRVTNPIRVFVGGRPLQNLELGGTVEIPFGNGVVFGPTFELMGCLRL
ncbi:MAG: PorP/SprF family type IX secretion system membrane protein [Bacteroidia bacterium]|nr:PorP/SprF family type IX secretion system membrane protein [Bacteroidia bacterium]